MTVALIILYSVADIRRLVMQSDSS